MFWHFNINKGQDNNSITKGNATTAIKKDTVILNALGQQTRIKQGFEKNKDLNIKL